MGSPVVLQDWAVRPSLLSRASPGRVRWRARCVCSVEHVCVCVCACLYTCVLIDTSCVCTLSRFLYLCSPLSAWHYSKQETSTCFTGWVRWVKTFKLRKPGWGCLWNRWIVSLRECWCPSWHCVRCDRCSLCVWKTWQQTRVCVRKCSQLMNDLHKFTAEFERSRT